MSDFNALKFVADNAGLNIFKALEKAYEQGKADVAPKWIPVSERLPEEERHYLVTDEAAGIAEVLIDEYISCDDGKWVWLYSQNAIAWMPLPKPWEGE